MLETAETFERHDLEENDFGYQVVYDNDWIFQHFNIDWTYVIDLDNLTFTVNGFDHWRLDSVPDYLDEYYGYEGLKREIPGDCLRTEIDLWPTPEFDEEERQQQYPDKQVEFWCQDEARHGTKSFISKAWMKKGERSGVPQSNGDSWLCTVLLYFPPCQLPMD